MKNTKSNLIMSISMFIFMFCFYQAYAQRDWNVWTFGQGAVIDFNNDPPTAGTGNPMNQIEGVASICDENGTLQLYTDGVTIWGPNNAPILTNLGGNTSSTQSGVIVRQPGTTNVYHVFGVDEISQNTGNGRINHAIITINAGIPAITQAPTGLSNTAGTGQTNIEVTERLTAIKRCDGNYWVLGHAGGGTNAFLRYEITDLGLTNPVATSLNAGSTHISAWNNANKWQSAGYMKFSHDGTKLACVIRESQANLNLSRVEIFNFNMTNGTISQNNIITLNNLASLAQGIEFSPNDDNLYLSCGTSNGGGGTAGTSHLYKYDLTSNDATTILNSRVQLSTSTTIWYGALQLAPNGLIYLAKRSQNNLGAISNSNDFATSAYDDNALTLGAGQICELGLPNFSQNFIEIESTTQCRDVDFYLNLEPEGYDYNWSPPAGLSCSNCPTPKVIDLDQTTTYRATYRRGDGACITKLFTVEPVNCCEALDKSANFEYTTILEDIEITENTTWQGKYYIHDDVIVTVKDDAILDITNVDIVFGACAGIDFIENSILRSNNSVYRPCDMNDTWRGLMFDNDLTTPQSHVINESTFKNAGVALFFMDNSDAKVSNNLFANCNHGIRIENNTGYDHPISGNRFVIDNFYPTYETCEGFLTLNSNFSFDIYAFQSNITKPIVQNEFTYARLNSNIENTGVTLESSTAEVSHNEFTNVLPSLALITGNAGTTRFEDNELVFFGNIQSSQEETGIFITNCNQDLIEINRNEIHNNTEAFQLNSGLLAENSSNISITGNTIYGFQVGADLQFVENCQITENNVTDFTLIGIHVNGVAESSQGNFITCNVVRANAYSGSTGISILDNVSSSEVHSNCIFDCSNAILFEWTNITPVAIPLTRNNYLYNYDNVGIGNTGYNGTIGTASVSGMNSFISNSNATDVQSTPTINAANNFNLVTLSGVVITSNLPHHSTSSCGHEVHGPTPQKNLDINLACDNLDNLLIIQSMPFRPNGSQDEPVSMNDLRLLIASMKQATPEILNYVQQATHLTENEKHLLRYSYHMKLSEYSSANSSIKNITPSSMEWADCKKLYSAYVALVDPTLMTFKDSHENNLLEVKEHKSPYSNAAISLLNHFFGYGLPYQISKAERVTFNVKTATTLLEDPNIKVFPNPSQDRITVVYQSNVAFNLVTLTDIHGKMLTRGSYKAEYLNGEIKIDLSNLAPGVYFIRLSNDQIKSGPVKRIVKL